MNVLLAAALPPPDVGGIISWTKTVCASFQSRNDVELSVLDMTPRYRSSTNVSLSHRLIGGSAQAMRDICRLRKRIQKNEFDAFHLCSSGGLATPKDITMLRVARRAGIPSVLHYHMGRLPDIIRKNGVSWKLKQKAIRLADVVVVLDKSSEDALKSAMPGAKVVRMPNMIDATKISQVVKDNSMTASFPADGRKRIVFVGYVVPAKGIAELIQACLRMDPTQITLDVVGPYEDFYRNELRTLAGGADSEKWLRFYGSRSRVEALEFIASADVFVLPSYTEGFPNVIMEAMSFARPIVSTPVGAIAEMLDVGGPDECGVLVPPRNADALFAAIRDMLAMPAEDRKALGEKARERVLRVYDVNVVVDRIFRLWSSLAHK